MPARQASCVAIGGRAVLIEGVPGIGKTSLALALIDRGAVLVGDDGVLLEDGGGVLLARPHPQTRGLVEVRNLGLIRFPAIDVAPVGLVIGLAIGAPRFIETAGSCHLCGLTVPMLCLTARDPLLALKTELALARFGTAASAQERTWDLPIASD